MSYMHNHPVGHLHVYISTNGKKIYVIRSAPNTYIVYRSTSEVPLLYQGQNAGKFVRNKLNKNFVQQPVMPRAINRKSKRTN